MLGTVGGGRYHPAMPSNQAAISVPAGSPGVPGLAVPAVGHPAAATAADELVARVRAELPAMAGLPPR